MYSFSLNTYYKVKKIEDFAYHTSLKMLFTATPCLLFTEPLSHTITLPLASVLGVSFQLKLILGYCILI